MTGGLRPPATRFHASGVKTHKSERKSLTSTPYLFLGIGISIATL